MTILFVPLLVVLAFFGYRLYLELKTKMLVKHEYAAEVFFEAVAPLLKDDETPVEVLLVLNSINRRIQTRGEMYKYLMYVKHKDRFKETDGAETEFASSIRHFFEKRPELREPYYRALAAGMLAISYQDNIIFGKAFRDRYVGEPELKKNIAPEAERKWDRVVQGLMPGKEPSNRFA